MWDRQGEVRGLSGCAGQMLRRSFLARAVDLDTRKYAAGERDDRQQEPKTNPIVPTISRNFRRLTSWNSNTLCSHLVRPPVMVRAGCFDQAISDGPQGGGRGVHLVKEGEDALIQTGKKQRTSDGVRLRLDLETPQGPVCWLTCL